MNKDEIKNLFTSAGRLDSNKTRKIVIPEEFSWTTSIQEYLFCLNGDICERPICYCGNELRFQGFKKGYSKYCSSSCSNKCPEKIEKFIKNVSQIEENGLTKAQNITAKAQETSLERYGVIGYNNREKEKLTKLERYGDEKYNNIEKAKETNLERYGKEYFFQTNEYIERTKSIKLERYGDENFNNTEKAKETNLERYGVENVRQCDSIISKIQSTRRKTMEEKGTMIPLEMKSDFEKYKREVWKITNKNDLSLLENIDKRGMAGVDGAYHLDHKISIFYGFTNDIPHDIIGHINNLRMIPWQENYRKGIKNDQDID